MMNFPDTVKIYIVGGYVRDRVLGLEGKDHDFVVVGATPQMMVDNGFQQVGADFPVYLHPLTGDEFALARQERKTGPGYHGFETTFDPSVTLEEDLRRRDLTMNAMAREVVSWNEEGHAKLSDEIIDPFNGQADLANGVIRHVSEAFAEDPVRVLRVARFAARYSFVVAPETQELMKQLVAAGELDHLTPERVWAELEKAMMEDHPSKFFWTLEVCYAKNILFPELRTALLSSGWSLSRASLRNATYTTRMLILFSYLGWQDVQSLLTRLKAPVELFKLTRKMSHVLEVLRRETYQGVWNATPEDILDLLNRIDAFRQQDDVFRVITAVDYLMSSSNTMAPRVDRILAAFRASRNVSFASLPREQRDSLAGPAVGQAINDIRLEKIKTVV